MVKMVEKGGIEEMQIEKVKNFTLSTSVSRTVSSDMFCRRAREQTEA